MLRGGTWPASSHVENKTKIRFLSWAQGSCKSIYRELFLLGPIRQRRKTKLGSGGAAATRHPLLSTACSAPAPQPQPARSSRLLSEGHAWDPIPESTSPKAERRAEGSCRLVPGTAGTRGGVACTQLRLLRRVQANHRAAVHSQSSSSPDGRCLFRQYSMHHKYNSLKANRIKSLEHKIGCSAALSSPETKVK